MPQADRGPVAYCPQIPLRGGGIINNTIKHERAVETSGGISLRLLPSHMEGGPHKGPARGCPHKGPAQDAVETSGGISLRPPALNNGGRPHKGPARIEMSGSWVGIHTEYLHYRTAWGAASDSRAG